MNGWQVVAPGTRVHVTQWGGLVDRGEGTVVDSWTGSATGQKYALVKLDSGTTEPFQLDGPRARVRVLK